MSATIYKDYDKKIRKKKGKRDVLFKSKDKAFDEYRRGIFEIYGKKYTSDDEMNGHGNL